MAKTTNQEVAIALASACSPSLDLTKLTTREATEAECQIFKKMAQPFGENFGLSAMRVDGYLRTIRNLRGTRNPEPPQKMAG